MQSVFKRNANLANLEQKSGRCRGIPIPIGVAQENWILVCLGSAKGTRVVGQTCNRVYKLAQDSALKHDHPEGSEGRPILPPLNSSRFEIASRNPQITLRFLCKCAMSSASHNTIFTAPFHANVSCSCAVLWCWQFRKNSFNKRVRWKICHCFHGIV